MRRDYTFTCCWWCLCMVLVGYKWSLHHIGFVTSISCLCHDLNWSIFSFVVMWNLVLNVVVSWRCCDCSIIRKYFLLGLLHLWMVKLSAISGETYGVPFVGFLFMIKLSNNCWLLSNTSLHIFDEHIARN